MPIAFDPRKFVYSRMPLDGSEMQLGEHLSGFSGALAETCRSLRPWAGIRLLGSVKEIFSSNFRRLLDAQFGGNAARFASKTSFKESTISRWSRGLSLPHSTQIDKIAKTFGVPVSDLFSDIDAPRTPTAIEVRDTLASVRDMLEALDKAQPRSPRKKS